MTGLLEVHTIGRDLRVVRASWMKRLSQVRVDSVFQFVCIANYELLLLLALFHFCMVLTQSLDGLGLPLFHLNDSLFLVPFSLICIERLRVLERSHVLDALVQEDLLSDDLLLRLHKLDSVDVVKSLLFIQLVVGQSICLLGTTGNCTTCHWTRLLERVGPLERYIASWGLSLELVWQSMASLENKLTWRPTILRVSTMNCNMVKLISTA